jgi:hypothetical protein
MVLSGTPTVGEWRSEMPRLTCCPCGSGEYPEAQFDGYGIFMCYTCVECEKKKMSKWRSDIHERYDADEPIDE